MFIVPYLRLYFLLLVLYTENLLLDEMAHALIIVLEGLCVGGAVGNQSHGFPGPNHFISLPHKVLLLPDQLANLPVRVVLKDLMVLRLELQ